jgi:hypothetical protein
MKALYVIWPDFDYIDKFIEAGIDTLLVTFFDLPNTKTSNWFNSWIDSVSVCERYKNTDVKILAVPLWSRYWTPVIKDQQFINNGVSLEYVPCPTCEEYINNTLDPFLILLSENLINGVVWDLEAYANGTPGIIDYWKCGSKCECSRCKDMSWQDQFKYHAELYKNKFQDVKTQGILELDDWCQLKRLPHYCTIYTERTYIETNKWDYFKYSLNLRLKRLYNRVLHQLNYNFVAGAFMEISPSTDVYLNYLETILKSKLFDGYWIHTQKMCSKYSKMSNNEIGKIKLAYNGYYETGLIDSVDPQFFNKLKALNKKY